MSYDLAVREGVQAADDAAATATFEDLYRKNMRHMGGQKTPPAPLVGQYVEALVARWPDLSPDDDEEDEDASPWSGLSTGGGKAAVTGRIAAGLDGLPAPARPCGQSARRAGRQPGPRPWVAPA